MNIRGRPLPGLTAQGRGHQHQTLISNHGPGENYLLLDSQINLSLEAEQKQETYKDTPKK